MILRTLTTTIMKPISGIKTIYEDDCFRPGSSQPVKAGCAHELNKSEAMDILSECVSAAKEISEVGK